MKKRYSIKDLFPKKSYSRSSHTSKLGSSNLPVAGIIGCCCLGTATVVAGFYFGLGTLGWNAVKGKVIYEEKFYEAANLADKNNDKNLDVEELTTFMSDLGVTLMPNQDFSEVRPSYKALETYVKQYK
jgi:hypothetical protein